MRFRLLVTLAFEIRCRAVVACMWIMGGLAVNRRCWHFRVIQVLQGVVCKLPTEIYEPHEQTRTTSCRWRNWFSQVYQTHLSVAIEPVNDSYVLVSMGVNWDQRLELSIV